jgi:hypothetical protein
MGDFYMVLPSNVIAPEYPNNKTSHYSTPLAKPINFGREEFEVGLSQFSYVHSFYNITWPLTTLTFKQARIGTNEEEVTESPSVNFVFLSEGYYDDASVLTKEINKLKPDSFKGRLNMDLISQKVRITLYEGETITLHKGLAKLLGYRDQVDFIYKDGVQIGNKKWVHYAQYVADLNPTMSSLYIYVDIIKEQFVGSSLVKLIRSIPINGKNGDCINENFNSPNYVPVAYSDINAVEIKICDDYCELIQFKFGRAVVKLHFRRRKTWL